VVLRWHIQLGSIPLPKSGDAQRQRENIDVFGFELSEAEMTAIASLERGRLRAEADPNTHEEF
jgi:diketogulonate reductase-like aldo/keto reductase